MSNARCPLCADTGFTSDGEVCQARQCTFCIGYDAWLLESTATEREASGQFRVDVCGVDGCCFGNVVAAQN